MTSGTLPPRLANRFRTLREIRRMAPRRAIASALIRVRNEARGLPALMESLASQTLFGQLELIFLDSESSDSTLEYLRTLDCNLYQIAAREFSFGETCNLMMALASTDVCFFFSGHVRLQSSRLLASAYEEIAAGRAAAGYFRQVPHDEYGASIYERAFLRRAFPLRDARVGARGAVRATRFSNAASVISREAWSSLWFPDVIASEDALWARAFHERKQGVIRYFAELPVAHSHHENPAAVEQRVYINAVAQHAGMLDAARALIRFPLMVIALLAEGAAMGEALQFSLAHLRAYLRSAAQRVPAARGVTIDGDRRQRGSSTPSRNEP